MLSGLADRKSRVEGEEMLRLIDSSPIPLGQVINWAKWNGRIRGLKLHVVYDPVSDNPTHVVITDANINDVEISEKYCLRRSQNDAGVRALQRPSRSRPGCRERQNCRRNFGLC